MKSPAILAILGAFTLSAHAQQPKPLKVMLITGGCCHDYKTQTEILKKGLEERINVTVDQVHVDDGSTKPALPIYGNPDYAAGYDLVIHDECAADVKDVETVKGVLKPHIDGTPAVALHCAMHSYRVGEIHRKATKEDDKMWFDLLGLQSSRHGQQKPIEIKFTDTAHPVTKGAKDWTTVNEELYNNVDVHKTASPLATGKQDGEKDAVVVWTNLYGPKKTRVFATTIGHNNDTVGDARYLDLVAKGVLWATDKLDAQGRPKAGFGRQKK
ncbi:ThuA domain-containing protein [Luteolibacter flavescens]|uniref:ThuA domain-containing protein n=1 Tax=Luteolibacter flavescens TaxID=1859460 RepID=A0ABT3FP92_9BACT|nr:ThuA domain-containing protein [Luteolibacter flavescens]MCW1885391.1 ThuA domain-containing protein [Luteolibacter flavescens]